jgi:hypothetical protein
VASEGALLGAVHEDRDGQQGQRRGIEHQEENLRIAGGSAARIELLQRAHGLEADRRGGIVQAQAIGGEIQGDQSQGRMATWHFGHQATEQGAQGLGQPIDDTGFFGDLEKAQPKREGAEQQHHHLDRQLGHGEQALDHCGENARIVAQQPLAQCRNSRHQEKAEPKAIKHECIPENSSRA